MRCPKDCGSSTLRAASSSDRELVGQAIRFVSKVHPARSKVSSDSFFIAAAISRIPQSDP